MSSQDVADIARGLTDAAVGHMSAIVPPVAGGAIALSSLVASGIAWLCYTEFRRTPNHIDSRKQRATTHARVARDLFRQSTGRVAAPLIRARRQASLGRGNPQPPNLKCFEGVAGAKRTSVDAAVR